MYNNNIISINSWVVNYVVKQKTKIAYKQGSELSALKNNEICTYCTYLCAK